MKYVEHINNLIIKKTLETKDLVLFGQNIAAGSRLTGLTKNLKTGDGGLIINTPNSEYTLTGLGFGLMISGVPSIFFTKQQDFLLLGIEQLVNSYNFIRRKKPTTSFTIVCVVMDLGYHGPQSSVNNFGDVASLARIPAFTVTNKVDAEEIITTHLVSPGFRIIGLSQRSFPQELLEPDKMYSNDEKTLFQYASGDKATVVCFNFSLPYGWELCGRLKEKDIHASLFSVSAVTPIDWSKIVEDVKKTKNLVVIDDSKSENLSCDNLLVSVLEQCRLDNKIVVKREFKGNEWLYPNDDLLKVDYDGIVNQISK